MLGGADAAGFLEAHRCRIYVHQPGVADQFTDAERKHDQYAVHWWLQRALQAHPWRVSTPQRADVVFFNASFTYGRDRDAVIRRLDGPGYMRERQRISAGKSLSREISELKEIHRTRPTDCKSVWFAVSFRTRSVMQHKESHPCLRWVRELDTGYTEHFQPLVTPFVVASPDWLTSDEHDAAVAQPAHVPWERRKLLFFAGHTPVLHISNVRWNLWRVLQGDSRVTLYSPDLIHQVVHARACAVGARYADTDTKRAPAVRAFLHQECARYCVVHGDAFLLKCSSSSSSTAELCAQYLRSPHLGASVQKRHCRILAAHNMTGASEELIAPVRLSQDAYMAEIMKHRFCLIAPGDDMSTHKIGETARLARCRGGPCEHRVLTLITRRNDGGCRPGWLSSAHRGCVGYHARAGAQFCLSALHGVD